MNQPTFLNCKFQILVINHGDPPPPAGSPPHPPLAGAVQPPPAAALILSLIDKVDLITKRIKMDDVATVICITQVYKIGLKIKIIDIFGVITTLAFTPANPYINRVNFLYDLLLHHTSITFLSLNLKK